MALISTFVNFRPLTGTPSNPPSTRVTPLSMRRRSPSPVVTGNVSRCRMRFESGGNSSTTGRIRFESGGATPGGLGGASTPVLRPETHSNNQTLPRTFRWNSNGGSCSDRSAVNRFLSGTNSSPTPWRPQQKYSCDSPYQKRRLEVHSVEGAAKFLTETLPSNNSGSCKN